MTRVDFIVPCYNEQDNIAPLVQAFEEAFATCAIDWGLIMVDDGSKDASFSAITALAQSHPNIMGIQFSRNFGKEAAILAGLQHSDADYIGIIDADLQQPPSVALSMLEDLLADPELDCVAAYQENRREGALVSALKARFYKIFARAARSDVIANASDFRIFRRVVADAILHMPEYHRFSKGIFAWVGYNTKSFPYTPQDRATGTSKWTLGSLFRYAFEGILSFTTQPLHAISVLGVVVCIIALIYFIVLLVKTLIQGVDTPGYASTFGLVLLMGGGQFLAIGIIGEYLARAYMQGKQRPVYLLRQIVPANRADQEGAVCPKAFANPLGAGNKSAREAQASTQDRDPL